MLKTLYERPAETAADYYSPVLLGPETLLRRATRATAVREVLAVLGQLEPDDYTRYLAGYYTAGLDRFGDDWAYGDICTVLGSAARLLAPASYLEIGVRRGRSMAMVAAAAPDVALHAFDMWMPDYAGMPNPGPGFVTAEMKRLGHRGTLEFHSGDSHATVPAFFAEHPDLTIDLITVDGDHSHDGALADLRTVIPHLSLGGALVFDDITHPDHPYLVDVWRHVVEEDGGLVAREFHELGYGVAVAVRQRPARPRPTLGDEARGRLRQVKRSLERFAR
jgi:predicted O-methyltransferase YrrM